VPLEEEGKEGKKERGDDQSSKMNFEEKRDWQNCLLVRQVTPNDHDTTTRGNDGTWSSDE
jgi:hypothetical protein